MDLAWLISVLSVWSLCLKCAQTYIPPVAHWNRFLTSDLYANTILVIALENPFATINFPKAKPLLWAKLECSGACSKDTACEAINFYATQDGFSCQLLPDNFCKRKCRLALQAWPGGLVYDKMGNDRNQACADQLFVGQITADFCETVRPGCRGVWPNCNDCVKTCYDCRTSRSYSTDTYYWCTLWPQGPFSSPIFSFCYGRSTYIVLRQVDWNNGFDTNNYRMPFSDMERLTRLNVYHIFELNFIATDGTWSGGQYKFTSIDTTGKLWNLSFNGATDGLGLGATTVSLDFVNITDDPYCCGSFWLLSASNATYCPGGKVGCFGTLRKSGSVKSTGISWPSVPGKIWTHADIKLAL